MEIRGLLIEAIEEISEYMTSEVYRLKSLLVLNLVVLDEHVDHSIETIPESLSRQPMQRANKRQQELWLESNTAPLMLLRTSK